MVKTNRETKYRILKSVRQAKGLKVSECGLEGANRSIYFNEDLTEYNQRLLKKVRDVRALHKYKSVYTSNGNIFIRRNDSSTPVKISSEEDLSKINNPI